MQVSVDFYARAGYNSSMKTGFFIPLLIVGLTFTLTVKTLDAPGLTWDEANFIPSSISYLNWFGILTGSAGHAGPEGFRARISFALSADTITHYWHPTSEHPPLAILLSGITMSLLHRFVDLIFAARISTAIVFSLLILLVYKFSDETYGQRAACFSALSLLIMPRTFGHAHFASLDICMAFTWLLTVFSFVKGISNRRWSIITGIAYGLALATKLNALFLPIPLLLWAHLHHRKDYSLNLIAMLLISPAVFFLMWPWLWPEPLTRTIHYLTQHLQRMSIPVYYLGTIYKESNAPWHYPMIMTAVTLPPAVLILTISGLIRILRNRLKDSSLAGMELSRLLQLSKLTGQACLTPTSEKTNNPVGDGHARPTNKVAQKGNYTIRLRQKIKPRHLVLGTGIFLLAISALPLIRIHPYYLSYYNGLVGGLKGAEQRGFETTYWGDTCNESILSYLNENAPENARIAFYPAGSNVAALYRLTNRLRGDIRASGLKEWETLDYLVLNCRQGFFDEKLWELYRQGHYEHATSFQNVLLTAIYRIQ
jgi:hypothetical protein